MRSIEPLSHTYMILKTPQIENFRGIESLTVDLDRINLPIGENNTGKTSVLKAHSIPR